ncbi:MAG: hypothetical protein GY711_21070 [bacterium]|nr:hypothetical protein [bacterium]
MGRLDEEFHRYFAALDRSGGEDRCYLCRRTPAEVKAFFGFDEDGSPIDAEGYGLEDVVLEKADIMSYRGTRPVCAVCQLNFETLFTLDEGPTLDAVLREVRDERDRLWPEAED